MAIFYRPPIYSAIAAFTADDGVSLFRFNNSTADTVGHIAYTATAGTVDYTGGRIGAYAGNFRQAAATVNYRQYNSWYSNGTTAFGSQARTVAMWASMDGGWGSEPTLLQMGSHSGGNSIWACGFSGTMDGKIICIGGDVNFGASPHPTDGTWFHIVYTMSADNSSSPSHSFYVNGEHISTVVVSSTRSTNSTHLLLGCGNWNSSTSNKYSGAYLDEVAIWKRQLTSAEVKTLYSAGGQII